MKLHLPVRLFRAVIALMTVVPAFTQAFEIPSTYNTIFVTTTDEVTGESSTSTDIAFLLQNDLTFSGNYVMELNAGERIFTSADPSEISSLTFTSDSELYVDSDEKLTLAGLNTVTFQSGVAELNASSTNMQHEGCIGGAIFAQGTGSITLLDNVSVNFTNNYSSDYDYTYGGAIYSYSGAISLRDNGSVTFLRNYSSPSYYTSYTSYASYGGAIYSYSGAISLSGNDSVTFSGNYASCDLYSSYGGAIYSSSGAISLSGNDSVTFSGNYASSDLYSSHGGAICSDSGAISLSGNDSVTFSGNYASAYYYSSGGAIYSNSGAISLSGNDSVTFSGNYSSCYRDYADDSYGGAIYNSYSGAITLSENGHVEFIGNSARSVSSSDGAYGGAIYSDGRVYIRDNDSVIFAKNYERHASSSDSYTYRLRSLYANSDVTLSAASGNSIEFQDSMYVWGKLDLNKQYTNSEGKTVAQTGDIIFTGAYTAEHLGALKQAYTDAEYKNSLTSDVGFTALYDGRLIIRDGAILGGAGLTVTTSISGMSTPTVLLQNAKLNQVDPAISFAEGTRFEVSGQSVVSASSLTLGSGCQLTLHAMGDNMVTPVLSLYGALSIGDSLTLNISFNDEEAEAGSYKLMSVTSFSGADNWTADKITVNGLDGFELSFDALYWEDNVLWLNFDGEAGVGQAPPLTEATWSDMSGTHEWDTSDKNWKQNKYQYAYKDGVAVVFGDEGAGTVTLVGNIAPSSVLVDSTQDYTWVADGAEGGRLSGGMKLTKRGSGVLNIMTSNAYTGGTLIESGTLVAGATKALGTGAVKLNGGALKIGAAGITNTISNTGNSKLQIADGITHVLVGTIANSGSLTLSGSFNADGLAPSGTIAATRVDLNGNKGNSGFAQAEGFTLQVVNGGIVNDDAATITYNGQLITLDNTGLATVEGGIQYNQYHIASGHTASVSAIAAKASSMGSLLGNISLATGGTLNADATANVNAVGGTIKLTAGTLSGTLKNVKVTATGGSINGTFSGNSTLTGSNYVLSSALKNNGTLTLSGSFRADALSKELTGVDVRVDVDGNEGGTSGFLRTGDFTVMISNGTVNSNNASVSYKGQVLSMTGGVGYGIGTVDYSNYLLTDGNSASVSDISDAANGALKDISMTGGNLTVDDSVVLDATGGNIIITDDSTLRGSIVDANITTVVGEYNSVIDSVISGGSSLTVNGGTITVTGDNSYTGGTTIEGGRLEVGHANALGAGDVALNGGTLDLNSYPVGNDIFATGGTLESGDNFGGKLTVNGDLTLGGETTAGGGILLQGGSISGGSIVDTDITVDGEGDMEISSDIRGNSSLTLNNGDLTISGNNNDYTGGTTINKGSLTIGSGSSLGSGDITLNGGTLNTNGQEITNNIVNNGGTLISSYILGEGHTLTVGKGGMSVVGNLTLAGGNLHFKGMPLSVDGKVSSDAPVNVLVCGYSVIDKEGTVQLADFGDNTVGMTAASFNNVGYGTLSYDETKNTLSITLSNKNIWVGGKGVNWVQGLNVGWQNYETFEAGNRVVFNTKGTVKIEGGVEPASVLVDVAKSLTFKTSYNKKTGLYSGSIVGKGCIVKRGAGKLTMNDGNTYSGGTFIEAGTVNAKGTSSFGTGAITLSGGTLNLASKAVANDITLSGAAAIKSGKKYLGTYTQTGGELMKGSVLNVAESATISGGVVNGTLSGYGTVFVTGDAAVGKTGKVTTNGLDISGSLAVSSKGLSMNSKTSAIEVNGGSLTSAGKLSAYSLTMTGGELTVSNPKPMSVSLKGDFMASSEADIDVYGAFSAAKLDLQGVTFTMGMEDVTGTAVPKAQSISLKDKYADNLISNSVVNIGGKMSVAGNLVIDGVSQLHLFDPSGKNKAQSLAVKGGLDFGGGSSLRLNGALSAKDLTLGSGTLTLCGAKLSTIKVSNSLTLEGGTTLNLGFNVTEKDVAKGKAYKVFTFKTIDPTITDAALNELLGLGTDAATLAFDSKRKAITLTVTDAAAWNAYAEYVRTGKLVAAASEDDELVESAGAQVLVAPADVDPMLGKVADTLVQSIWGTAGASRAFADTIAARGTHATALADGKAAAWISTMGGSSRISSDGAHAGADYTLTGAAFGMEARLSEQSTVGLAIGNSRGKVSTFSAFPVDADSTHQGIYGKHLLGSSTTLSWMATHTRTESDANLAGMACDWTQDALQLDARVDKLFAISDRTTVSAFVGMQYLATDKGECNGLSTGSLQNLRGEIGVSAAHKATDKAYIYGELSFIGDMVRHNPTATVGDYRSRGATPGRAGLNLSVGASYQLNDSWSLNGSYSLELMQNQTSHSANVGATYSF